MSTLTPDTAKALWLPHFPWPKADGHKYSRGHALVIGGPLERSGAAKLAATAALRTAAGLVTVLAPDEEARKTYIASSPLNALMWGTHDQLADYLADERVTAVIAGPGMGRNDALLGRLIDSGKPLLLDADALHSPHHAPQAVLTPHEGEFARLFAHATGTRAEKAQQAAQATGSVVVLKGPRTIVAAADGRLFENDVASPWLATAGSGDTLAGIIGGLLAAGMPGFEAAIAGVSIHSRAGALAGPGLVADDLANHIPAVLASLR